MDASQSFGASNTMSSSSNQLLKRGSDDVGWDFAILSDPTNLDKVQCKLCGKKLSGGIYRIKQHIGHIKGNVSACPNSSDEDKAKCKAAIEEGKTKKRRKNTRAEDVRGEVLLQQIVEEDEDIEVVGSRKKPLFLGPIDKFALSINPNSPTDERAKMQQQNINNALWTERTHSVHQYLARWVYENGISFHAIENDSFKRFVEAVGQFGPGYQPPSQHQLREPLLKEEVERTKNYLKKQEQEWTLNGCSVITDAWSDRKTRSIMNLYVNSKKGTTFLSSKEASVDAHTGAYIFENVDKCIEDVGPQNVVQVVTDNASYNMEAAKLLMVKRPNIFWTSCATHTLNLILQGIGDQPRFKLVIEKAKAFTIFVYAHDETLALMRKFTKKKDIVRPGVTRFATSFLTLQSLMQNKYELRSMVVSDKWDQCKHSKSTKGKTAYSTILSMSFWNGVALCLKVFAPLVKVLRLVDGDKKPSMGFLYGELQEAKKDIIEAFKCQEANFSPILQIIDEKARDRLDSPLHLVGYFLNPYYFYKDQSIQNDPLIMDETLTCIHKFFPNDIDVQNQVTNIELLKYINKEGAFGRALAEVGCAKNDDNYDPVGWWSNYGNSVPKLQRMAIRILSLTTSLSGCVRNWSTFDGTHTRKMNRLDATTWRDLVYVQSNAKIINKKKREKEMGVDVLHAREANMAQGWIVDGVDEEFEIGMDEESSEVDMRFSKNVEVRELHDKDFVLDEDTEGEGDDFYAEFESDTERILEGYGEEELVA